MKIKFTKSLAMLISVLLIISSVFVTASATNSATVSAEQIGSANPGQTITIPVKINNNPGIMGFSVSVKYDKTALTPVSVSSGTILNGLFDDSIGTSEAGSFDVVWSGTENCTQNGILFNVTFTVNSNAIGITKIELSYSQADTFNENWQDVVLNCEGINLPIESQHVTESALSVGNVNTLANKTVTVPVSVNGNNPEKSFSFTIIYDSKVLIPKAVSSEKYDVISSNVSNANGTLNIELSSNNPQSGVAANIEFFVKSEAEGKYNLNAAASTSMKCISGSISVSTPDGTAYISANNYESLRGETITVPIKISNNSGIMGYRLTFTYDESVFAPISAVAGEGFTGNFDNSIGIKSNMFNVVWSNSSNITTNGTIAILTFRINDDATFGKSKIAISYSQIDTFDEEWNDVKFVCSDFTVNVKSVKINNAKESIKVGETVQFTASTAASENVSWISSNESVAIVDSTGKVTAVGSGTVTITAFNENGSESIVITVEKTYCNVNWIIDGKSTQSQIAIGSTIEAPRNPNKQGYRFVGWSPSIPTTMPDYDLTFTAQFELISKLEIQKPSTTIVNYGDTLVLHADLKDTDLPEGCSILWTAEGNGMSVNPSDDGMTCKVTSIQNGIVTIKATIADENGEPLLDDEENEISSSVQLTSKVNFWQKIVSFFKNLFGISRMIFQSL